MIFDLPREHLTVGGRAAEKPPRGKRAGHFPYHPQRGRFDSNDSAKGNSAKRKEKVELGEEKVQHYVM
jgi:hypothetical protein